MKLRRIISIIAFLLGTVLLFTLLALAAVIRFNSAPVAEPGADEEQDGIRIESNLAFLEVRKGESAQSVGLRLERAGLIRNRYFWYALCRFEKDFLKSGYYQLEIPASQMAIHRILVTGRQILRRVTIPEGFTLQKTARVFEDAGICQADDFLNVAQDQNTASRYRIPFATMEGYLFPDTYLFPPEYPAVKVVETLVNTFFSRIGEIDSRARDMDPNELGSMVIMASIVEREYRIDEEASLMAGVFFNRLGIGMALQSCATVEYVITEIQGRPHPEVLSTRDTEIRDPYNTYIRPGLPPGPICSPGATSLKAAFEPAPSDYLYFRLVEPSSGRHYFSRTFDDHIRAGLLYVK
ncbi:MAG: endolytic transglycosylase MltG [Treponema sp.]|jgi:UPF0755 protein|nr:endolytic transglycosylase MltG [Treponema sp.]